MNRYIRVVQSRHPQDLPKDPREFVRALDIKTMQEQANKVKPRKWRKMVDPIKQAKTDEKRRIRKINKADKKANREHRKRAKKGLPHDPKIDEEAIKTKISLGWDAEKAKEKKEKVKVEKEKRLENLPTWKVYQVVHKAEKKAAKAHKRNQKGKKEFDPSIDEKLAQLKAEVKYDPSIHRRPISKKQKAKREGQHWEGRGHVDKRPRTEESSSTSNKPAFFIDDFGSNANHIPLSSGGDGAFHSGKSPVKSFR